jgi:hypothetical protein
MTTILKEVWKPLPKELNLSNYSVSNKGVVLNHKNNRKYVGCSRKERTNRVEIQLTTDHGKSKTYQMNRLVAFAHIQNDDPENKPHVDHIDRDPSNNWSSNLRWSTVSDNNKNRKHITYGRKRKIVRVTKDGRFIKQYEKSKEAAEELGLDPSLIVKCCKGKRDSTRGYYFKYYYDFYGDLDSEEWKDVTLFKDLTIKVSNKGRIKDKQGVTYGYNNNGYKCIQKRGKTFRIHRLVANAFHTIKNAAYKTNSKRRLIGKVLTGRQKMTNGYKWFLLEDFYQLFPFHTHV